MKKSINWWPLLGVVVTLAMLACSTQSASAQESTMVFTKDTVVIIPAKPLDVVSICIRTTKAAKWVTEQVSKGFQDPQVQYVGSGFIFISMKKYPIILKGK